MVRAPPSCSFYNALQRTTTEGSVKVLVVYRSRGGLMISLIQPALLRVVVMPLVHMSNSRKFWETWASQFPFIPSVAEPISGDSKFVYFYSIHPTPFRESFWKRHSPTSTDNNQRIKHYNPICTALETFLMDAIRIQETSSFAYRYGQLWSQSLMC